MPAGVQRLYVPDLQWKRHRRHYRDAAGDHETVRAVPMAKVQRAAEMTVPGRQAMTRNKDCAWPVIDATFRYSIFLLGTLVAHAPFYSGILQGQH
jgi:hypothetical protein